MVIVVDLLLPWCAELLWKRVSRASIAIKVRKDFFFPPVGDEQLVSGATEEVKECAST